MATDQFTLPLADDDLITLAVHRHSQADREGATTEDYLQLVDIFPAILQRLREKMQQAADFIEIPRLRDPELDRICY
jgi:hypothetical protein